MRHASRLDASLIALHDDLERVLPNAVVPGAIHSGSREAPGLNN